MRHFLVTYTVRFNRRNGRTGHVFQGRFKSLLVDEDEYLLPLSRYIHLNPIRTSQFKDADFPTKSEYLKKYPWSTFPGYCYLRKRNKNIDYDWFLSTYFGGDSAKGRRHCREYVFNTIEGEIENPFEEVVHQSILGGQDFVNWVRQKLPQKGQREIPSLTKLQQHISVERIMQMEKWRTGVYGQELEMQMLRDNLPGSKNKTKTIELNPNGAESHAQFSYILCLSDKIESAIKLIKRAIRLNPIPPPHYYDFLAMAYRDNEQFEKAIELSEKALSNNPDQLSAYLTLAASYRLWINRSITVIG
jgi:hypothetical protein